MIVGPPYCRRISILTAQPYGSVNQRRLNERGTWFVVDARVVLSRQGGATGNQGCCHTRSGVISVSGIRRSSGWVSADEIGHRRDRRLRRRDICAWRNNIWLDSAISAWSTTAECRKRICISRDHFVGNRFVGKETRPKHPKRICSIGAIGPIASARSDRNSVFR